MTVATAVRADLADLPDALKTAQAAMELPDVREMLKRLGTYNLGIFMPHLHDERGAFQPLPAGVVQVEDGLNVSFRDAASTDVAAMVPIGWVHDANAIVPGVVMACVKRPNDTMHYSEPSP